MRSPPIYAAKHRVLVAKVGMRLLRTHEWLMERGIALEERMLKELLRKDPGIFQTTQDIQIAKKAVKVCSTDCPLLLL